MKMSRGRLPTAAQRRKALKNDFILEDTHQYRVDRHTFTIYVGSDPIAELPDESAGVETGVEHFMADRFDINLGILSGIDPSTPILVKVASCGGLWDEGMQMFGAILTCPNPVTVMATKWARSMTSIIPLAADRFVLRPPCQYMFHHGTYGFEGLAGEEEETNHEQLVRSREMMLDIYVARLKEQGKFRHRRAGYIRETLRDRMRRKIDVWLTADEAVEWGFADSVFTGDMATLRATAKNAKRRQTMLEVLRRPVTVS